MTRNVNHCYWRTPFQCKKLPKNSSEGLWRCRWVARGSGAISDSFVAWHVGRRIQCDPDSTTGSSIVLREETQNHFPVLVLFSVCFCCNTSDVISTTHWKWCASCVPTAPGSMSVSGSNSRCSSLGRAGDSTSLEGQSPHITGSVWCVAWGLWQNKILSWKELTSSEEACPDPAWLCEQLWLDLSTGNVPLAVFSQRKGNTAVQRCEVQKSLAICWSSLWITSAHFTWREELITSMTPSTCRPCTLNTFPSASAAAGL